MKKKDRENEKRIIDIDIDKDLLVVIVCTFQLMKKKSVGKNNFILLYGKISQSFGKK